MLPLIRSLFLILASVCVAIISAIGQSPAGAAINATGNPPHPSAMLDVSGSGKGVLINRMTTAERNSIENPAEGLQIYNTDTKCLNFYIGSSWKQVCGECDFGNPVVSNNGPICDGEDLYLYASTISGATYQWSGPNGFASTDQNPQIISASSLATGTYFLTATLNGCTTSAQTTIATVYGIPSAPVIDSNSPVCAGSALGLEANAVPGATYSWTGPDGFSSSTQNPVLSNATVSASGTYTAQITVNGCISPSSSLTAVVHEIPSSDFTPESAYTGVAIVFTPYVSGASYSWTFQSGSVTSSTLENPAVSWSTSGTYSTSLTVSQNNCTSSVTTKSISVTTPVSCKSIKTAVPTASNGLYTIDPDGANGIAAFPAYCDMTTDGGGWTIVHAVTGGNDEQCLVSDAEFSGNPLLFQHHNRNRAQKMALSAISTESIFVRNNATWLKAAAPLFDNNLNTPGSHSHVSTNLTANNGATTNGVIGYANYNYSGGGDFGVCTASGFDHHDPNYYHLNNGCGNQYIYSYSLAPADFDAGYDANSTLGTWTATQSCDQGEGGSLVFYSAMR